jgi:hypothetical protein
MQERNLETILDDDVVVALRAVPDSGCAKWRCPTE